LSRKEYPLKRSTAFMRCWNIEVDFRTIRATLQMDVLRCKSNTMVEKEIAIYLLAYNLVRWTMGPRRRYLAYCHAC